MNSQPVIIIPARYGSSRFPGKPLSLVRGKMMIERVWEIAVKVAGKQGVYVATDDDRIIKSVESFGAQAVRTPVECKNGTERTYAAIQALKLSPDIVINLQGDAPLTPPWFIEALIEYMKQHPSCEYATPAVNIKKDQYADILASKKVNPFSGTFVTFSKEGKALYFSKQMIPALRTIPGDSLPLYKHIGIYAYRTASLERYNKMQESVLESVEGLEQLRLLENGYTMQVICVDFKGRSSWAVDAPEDLKIVEGIIDREGELVLA